MASNTKTVQTMTDDWLQRTTFLLGNDAITRLRQSRILVVGVGGVGAYAAEMLVRAGIGHMTLIDSDNVSTTNINRQLIALQSTVGQPKVTILSKRLLDISPYLEIEARQCYLEADDTDDLLMQGYDFVVDAIDTIAPKTALLAACVRHGIAVISSMGAGARLDPSQIQYADISKTYRCGLAKAVRTRLRKMGIEKGIPVVFSTEQPQENAVVETISERNKRSIVGTVSYMPVIFGCYLAAFVIRQLSQS